MAVVESRTFKRQDGKDKVTGLGRYTADMQLAGMTHCKFLYAGIANGRITRLDTSKAEALAGVFAVVTHADVPDLQHCPYIQDRRLFARVWVRFEGEIIAAVAATTPAVAPNGAGVGNRPIGIFSLTNCRLASSTEIPAASARAFTCTSTNGVSTHPGQIALQVIPSFASSIAPTFVNPTSPCFAAT